MATTALVRMPRADEWADRICRQLGKSVEAIIEVGRLLVAAKAKLPHGEFTVREDPLFDRLKKLRWQGPLNMMANARLRAGLSTDHNT